MVQQTALLQIIRGLEWEILHLKDIQARNLDMGDLY